MSPCFILSPPYGMCDISMCCYSLVDPIVSNEMESTIFYKFLRPYYASPYHNFVHTPPQQHTASCASIITQLEACIAEPESIPIVVLLVIDVERRARLVSGN